MCDLPSRVLPESLGMSGEEEEGDEEQDEMPLISPSPVSSRPVTLRRSSQEPHSSRDAETSLDPEHSSDSDEVSIVGAKESHDPDVVEVVSNRGGVRSPRSKLLIFC